MNNEKTNEEKRVIDLNPQLKASMLRVKAAIQQQEAEKKYQLKLWPDKDMGVPNELSRSALFAAIDPRKPRVHLQNQLIVAQGDYTIRYTGPQLDQSYFDIFQGIIHVARGVHEGDVIHFTAHQILKLIGRSTGGQQHKWFYTGIQNLTATSIAIIKGGKQVFWDSLLRRGKGDLETGKYSVEISRDLAKLFERGFTHVEWNQRHRLLRKPLAQWLQFYYASHAKPLPVSVDFIRTLSGSSTQVLRKFRQNLKEALNQIQAVGVIDSWQISEDDLVHIMRTPSTSQQKHLSYQPE